LVLATTLSLEERCERVGKKTRGYCPRVELTLRHDLILMGPGEEVVLERVDGDVRLPQRVVLKVEEVGHRSVNGRVDSIGPVPEQPLVSWGLSELEEPLAFAFVLLTWLLSKRGGGL
jgi:hypothetical protein